MAGKALCGAEIKWLNPEFMASLNIYADTSELDSKVFLKSKQNLSVYFFIMLYFGISMGEELWISTRLGNSLMLFFTLQPDLVF